MKQYPKYKDSGVEWIGKIPEQWKIIKGKYALTFNYGFPFDSTKFTSMKDGNMPLLRIRDLSKGYCETYFEGNYPETSVIKENDLLIGMDGDFNLVRWKGKDALLNQRICKLEKSDLNKKYMYYVLPFYLNIINDLTYFTTVKHLSGNDLLEQSYIFPPYPEQQAIAGFLDNKTTLIDEAIEKKQHLIELLQEQRTAIINHAVTKGLNPKVKMKDSGVEWLGDIPEHWSMQRLASIGRFSKGKGISRADLIDNGIPAILYGDIYTKYHFKAIDLINQISEDTAKNSAPINEGTLLFTASGETFEDIGKTIVYLGKEVAYAGGDVIIFTQDEQDGEFLSYSLNTSYAQYQKSLTGRGDIIVHTSSSKLKNILLSLPPIKEQQQIINYLNQETLKIDQSIEKIKKEIELLQEYRTALISEAVTGKIDVRGLA